MKLYAGSISLEQRFSAAVVSFSRMMQDQVNMAYYTTKYSTKDNPLVSEVLPEQAVGVERLRQSEEEAYACIRTSQERE